MQYHLDLGKTKETTWNEDPWNPSHNTPTVILILVTEYSVLCAPNQLKGEGFPRRFASENYINQGIKEALEFQ
jgi:hypothetical protein